MILFLDKTGPLIEYKGGTLYIEDLNPHVATRWRMSRTEMLMTGLRFLWAAISSKEKTDV